VAAKTSACSDGFTYTEDSTAQPPSINQHPDLIATSPNASFTFSDVEAISSYTCQLDDRPLTDCTGGSANYLDLPDGKHTFNVVAKDLLENVSVPTSFVWAVATPLGAVRITDAPPALTNQPTARFNFSSDGPVLGYECQLDGKGFSPCQSPQPYQGLGDGQHTFDVRAVSLGGTAGTASTYPWTVDTTAPETSITSAPTSPSNSAQATFAFASSEGASSFVCSLNSGGFTPCTSPETYSGLGNGSYTFRVQAVDAAGNADPSAANYTWQIAGVGAGTRDLKPPANVTRLRRNVGYGRLQLRWLKPRDADFDHVGVYVSTSAKTPPRKLVYSGRSQSYTDKHFKNGQYYRYLIVSYDHEKNASGGMPAPIGPGALMTAPRNGAVLHKAPKFRWSGVRGASFYNIQLYTHGEKVLSSWPAKPRQLLTGSWRYGGRRYSLRPGVYVWYVWPGFGQRTKSRYGPLLGYASFRVR
jgi:hypothetical protein